MQEETLLLQARNHHCQSAGHKRTLTYTLAGITEAFKEVIQLVEVVGM